MSFRGFSIRKAALLLHKASSSLVPSFSIPSVLLTKQDECASHTRHWILFHSLILLVGLWSTLAEILVHPLQVILGRDCFTNSNLVRFTPKSVNPDTSLISRTHSCRAGITWRLWVHSLLSGCLFPLPGVEHLSSLLTELQLAVNLFPN